MKAHQKNEQADRQNAGKKDSILRFFHATEELVGVRVSIGYNLPSASLVPKCVRLRQIALVALVASDCVSARHCKLTASQHILTYVEAGVSGVTQESGFHFTLSYTSIQVVVTRTDSSVA